MSSVCLTAFKHLQGGGREPIGIEIALSAAALLLRDAGGEGWGGEGDLAKEVWLFESAAGEKKLAQSPHKPHHESTSSRESSTPCQR